MQGAAPVQDFFPLLSTDRLPGWTFPLTPFVSVLIAGAPL